MMCLKLKTGSCNLQLPVFKNRQKVGKRKFPDFDSNTHNHLKIIFNSGFPLVITFLFDSKTAEKRDDFEL